MRFYCDIFCRVIDNFGDVGVTLRLARQLADEHHATVRLIVDDVATYARIAAEASPNLSICAWHEALIPPEIMLKSMPEDTLNKGVFKGMLGVEIGQSVPKLLVIEAFGCALPDIYIDALAAQYGAGGQYAAQLCWLNLEYLSAESWVETHHLLPSPHPRLPLTKTFFFPGFTARTGGLLREADLAARREAFLRAAEDGAVTPKHKFLAALGVPPSLVNNAVFIFLFCYENNALPSLLQAWQASSQPILCLLPAERTQAAVCAALGLDLSALVVGVPKQFGALTLLVTPLLPQPEFDKLLWACDVNFVRGEDSIVRAHWAAKPFCWQVYVQEDGAHLIKLEAFLQQLLADASPQIAQIWRKLFMAWNTGDALEITTAWQLFYANLSAIKVLVDARNTALSSQSDCATNIVAQLYYL